MEDWENEVREDAIAYSREQLAYYEGRLALLKGSKAGESAAKRGLRRHYERMIAKERSFLARVVDNKVISVV